MFLAVADERPRHNQGELRIPSDLDEAPSPDEEEEPEEESGEEALAEEAPPAAVDGRSNLPATGSDQFGQFGMRAIGWRVGVWWKMGDGTEECFDAVVTDYEVVKGKHELWYDDNKVQWAKLAEEKVVWKAEPGGFSPPQRPQVSSREKKSVRSWC